jgi:hypothetical protein
MLADIAVPVLSHCDHRMQVAREKHLGKIPEAFRILSSGRVEELHSRANP